MTINLVAKYAIDLFDNVGITDNESKQFFHKKSAQQSSQI